ncbi:MAG: hypothetical protein IPM17_11780 [Verrucomicrobia bacterium]|nr:hypothetical protein [Verrucomicrobiota bacterium]
MERSPFAALNIMPSFFLRFLCIALLGPRLLTAQSELHARASGVAPASEALKPTVEEILRRVGERWRLEEQQGELFRQRYAFTHRKVTEKWDDEGMLKERTEESLRHDPRQPEPERRKNARRERQGPGYRTDDFEELGGLYARFEYRLVGQEDVNGRPAWVIEFRPKNPPLPARSLKERFVNAVAGRTWIDREDHAPARLELRLIREVNVVGGLVGNVRACEVRFERRRTEDGLWYTPRFTWHLEGRALFSKKHMTHTEETADLERVE